MEKVAQKLPNMRKFAQCGHPVLEPEQPFVVTSDFAALAQT
jgi:hypothetical protein